MASTNKDSKGWRVEFTIPGQPRRPLRLGKGISEKSARDIGRHVERIVESKKTGLPLAAETEKWLLGLPDKLRQQLVSLGLISDAGPRMSRSLGGFLDEYVKGRTDLKAGSLSNIATARRWLEKYFGTDRDMGSITLGEADAYRRWLVATGKQAENTVRRLCGRAKQFFRAAVRQRLIAENPFADMKHLIVTGSPKDRIRKILGATADKVLASCPDSHWRVIFALARYVLTAVENGGAGTVSRRSKMAAHNRAVLWEVRIGATAPITPPFRERHRSAQRHGDLERDTT